MFDSKNLKISVILFGVLFWTMGLFAITEQIMFVKNQNSQGLSSLKANVLKTIQSSGVRALTK